jgi:hypothetical protein
MCLRPAGGPTGRGMGRTDRLCGRAAGSSGDDARMVFADLAQLILAREIAEERAGAQTADRVRNALAGFS